VLLYINDINNSGAQLVYLKASATFSAFHISHHQAAQYSGCYMRTDGQTNVVRQIAHIATSLSGAQNKKHKLYPCPAQDCYFNWLLGLELNQELVSIRIVY
jgi:hypothetical protein